MPITPAHYTPGLAPLLRPLAGLALDAKNARAHSDRNIRAICDSLVRFGQHASERPTLWRRLVRILAEARPAD